MYRLFKSSGANNIKKIILSKRLANFTRIKPIHSRGFSTLTQDRNDFLAFYPTIAKDLVDKAREYDPIVAKWLERSVEYNVTAGKKNRGVTTVLAYKAFCEPSNYNADDLRLANLLGWCIELVHVACIMLDDIMDCSYLRRGEICWHRVDDGNVGATNDALTLINGVYLLLKKYFRDKSYYVDLLDIFHDIFLKTIFGQAIDIVQPKDNVLNFTREAHHTSIYYKTSYFSVYFPVALGLHVAGKYDTKMIEQIQPILTRIGDLFQIYDDYTDYYGDKTATDKVGTDIEDNKCSWLTVTFLERATDAQKLIMAENYGHRDVAKVNKIKQMYDEMDMKSIYKQFEKEEYYSILADIERLPNEALRKFCSNIFDKYNTSISIQTRLSD